MVDCANSGATSLRPELEQNENFLDVAVSPAARGSNFCARIQLLNPLFS